MPDIEHPPVGADRDYGRPARDREFGLRCQLPGVTIQGESRDLVVVLQANIESVWHFDPLELRFLATL